MPITKEKSAAVKKAGTARMASMTARQRSNFARKGAEARWGTKKSK